MKFVEWCGLFLIGHATIDRQHQELFKIANNLYKEVDGGFNKKLTIETLSQLIQYAQKHFRAEEGLAERFGFPEEILATHKKTHEKLVMDIFQLNDDIETGKVKSMYDIEKFITNWLVLHILIEDKKYRDYLT